MRAIVIILAVIETLITLAIIWQRESTKIIGPADYVVDGDTLSVAHTRIRLGDFDAPELSEPGGREAKTALEALVWRQVLSCSICQNRRYPGRCRSYARLIATCRLSGGEALGDLMRANGVGEGGR